MNQLLSLVIPSYNRAELLKGCLDTVAPQAKAGNLEIVIMDNGSTDHTAAVVEQFRKGYDLIRYHKNAEVLGDPNVEITLKLARTRYVWLIGDRVRVLEGAVKNLLKYLENDTFDAIVVNSFGVPPKRMVEKPRNATIYHDHDRLLSELGWWMTFFGATIWSRDMIVSGCFTKYHGTSYVQVGVMFEYFAGKTPNVLWVAEPAVYTVGRSGWLKNAFEVLITRWMETVMSLPSVYSMNAREKCIKDLGVNNRWLSLIGFLVLRAEGIYDRSVYSTYRERFQFVTRVPRLILFLVAIFPPIPAWMFRFYRAIARYVRSALK